MASTLSCKLCCKICIFETLRSWLAESHALARGPVALRRVPDQNMAARCNDGKECNRWARRCAAVVSNYVAMLCGKECAGCAQVGEMMRSGGRKQERVGRDWGSACEISVAVASGHVKLAVTISKQ